jgi:hypothetical protein
MTDEVIINTSPEQKQIKINLEKNAESSLIHGVEHFLKYQKEKKDIDMKFAIIHIFHAIELYLKARLAQEHFTLIFKEIDRNIDVKRNTVSVDVAIQRLRNAKVDVGDTDCVISLKDERNNIEHHELKQSENSLNNYVGQAIVYIEEFIKREKGKRISSVLTRPVYHELYVYVNEYKKKLKEATNRMTQYINALESGYAYKILRCKYCNQNTIVIV